MRTRQGNLSLSLEAALHALDWPTRQLDDGYEIEWGRVVVLESGRCV